MARKKCIFCSQKIRVLDFKETSFLSRFLSPWMRIKSARETRVCSRHQRMLTQAIKNARIMGLLPFTPAQARR